jgi:flagellar biosynthesis protein FliQ
MNPVFENIYQKAYQPYTAGKMNFSQAVDVGSVPLKEFMLKQTRRDDLNLFAKMYGKPINDREEVPMTVLIPAFAISEIKTGFLIGFVIYLPFLAIDFAVASILTSLGMVMVSPMMFSLPLKLIIFALADGWTLLSLSLVQSYFNYPMDSGLIIDLVYQALRMAALLAGPTLLALLVVGLVLGILQAATSINESTVAFVPKLVVFGLVVLLAGPVTLALFVDYIKELLGRIPGLIS